MIERITAGSWAAVDVVAEAERRVWATVRDAVTQLADAVVDLDRQVAALRGAEAWTERAALESRIRTECEANGIPLPPDGPLEAQLRHLMDGRDAEVVALRAERDKAHRHLYAEQRQIERERWDMRAKIGSSVLVAQVEGLHQVLAEQAKVARLARVLAVERGDASQAPEGWTTDGDDWRRGRVSVQRYPTSPTDVRTAWEVYVDSYRTGPAYPTALEAMEAIDAEAPDAQA